MSLHQSHVLDYERQYRDLVQRILTEGVLVSDRTGVGTKSVFSHMLKIDLRAAFPLITSKFTAFKPIKYELAWMLRGDSNVKWLQENGVTIWDEWAGEDGSLGHVYGELWRNWGHQGIDQIQNVIDTLRDNPTSRRNIVMAWHPGMLDQMALPPCHMMMQWHAAHKRPDGGYFVDLQMYQRSCDVFLGLPFNIASYALLMHLVSSTAFGSGQYTARYLNIVLGDAHLYSNHLVQAETMLSRKAVEYNRFNGPPRLQEAWLPAGQAINRFMDNPDYYSVIDYRHNGVLKGDVAV